MRKPSLLDVVRDRALVRRFSPRTVDVYARWVWRYVEFHGRVHPRTLGAESVREFLTYLAQTRGVAASTQNQALAALRFLYSAVLEAPLPVVDGPPTAKRPHTLPNVLAREDVARVLAQMQGVTLLMAQLLYGSGLRLQECCQLRVKDVDLTRGELLVRRGKGARDRVTMLPLAVHASVEAQLNAVRLIARQRATRGGGSWQCPVHWRRRHHWPPAAGRGGGCSRRHANTGMRPVRSDAPTISTQRCCSGQWLLLASVPALLSG